MRMGFYDEDGITPEVLVSRDVPSTVERYVIILLVTERRINVYTAFPGEAFASWTCAARDWAHLFSFFQPAPTTWIVVRNA